MFLGKRIGVIIPAYNEEKLIGRVIETMPGWVDLIIVIDDCSRDQTVRRVREYRRQQPERVILIEHSVNQGVGGAMVSGYRGASEREVEVVVVMGGDAQMDPADLEKIVGPVARGEVDYTKGNRLFSGEAWEMIPRVRYLGNAVLSLLTKIASGYWHIADSQAGYTAVSREALLKLNLSRVYKRYGVPNDLLVKLNILNCRVKDVPVRPVYNIGEKSGIRLWQIIPQISWLLVKGFIERLVRKYVITDFHPLVFFYTLTLFLGLASVGLAIRLVYFRITFGDFPPFNTLALIFTLITGLQSLFFAMWFDMEYNKELR